MRINRQRLTTRRTTPPCGSTCTDINAFGPSHYENSKVQKSLRLQHSCNPRPPLALLGGPCFVRATRCTPHGAQCARMCGCPSHHAWTWVTSGTPPTTRVAPYTVLDVPSSRTPPAGARGPPHMAEDRWVKPTPPRNPCLISLFPNRVKQCHGTLGHRRPVSSSLGRGAAPGVRLPRTCRSPARKVPRDLVFKFSPT